MKTNTGGVGSRDGDADVAWMRRSLWGGATRPSGPLPRRLVRLVDEVGR